MTRLALLSGVLAGFTLGACVHAAPGGSASLDLSRHIISLERSALDRWIRADPDGYLGIYAPDATYFDPFTAKRVDGLEALKARLEPMRGITLPFTEPRYEMIDPVVRVEGNVAVLTFTLVNYGKPTGNAKEAVLARWNATEVYRRVDDAWRIIHTHWSFTQPQLAAPARP